MLEPAGHRILVELDPVKDEETVSDGGIVLATGKTSIQIKLEQSGKVEGTIVAIGKNAWKAFPEEEAWAEVGDRILMAKFSGMEAIDPDPVEEDKNRIFALINDEDITCILHKGKQVNKDYRKEAEDKVNV